MNDLKGIIEDCNKSDLVSDKVIKKIIEIIGQEKWNDIYDEESDICTTMGELIITLKGIADLESENAENESEARELNIRIDGLIKENAELKKRNAELKGMYAHSAREAGTYKQFLEAKEKENAELKTKVGLSIDCDKAKKDGELCLGYGGDEDEPCEQCKNCIKCECGYYQLGETEKDDQLTKAKEIIKTFLGFAEAFGYSPSLLKKQSNS